MRLYGLRHEGRPQIDTKHPVPIGERHVEEAKFGINSGAVDHNVGRLPLALDKIDQR